METKIKPCPFCGGEAHTRMGYSVKLRFFCCSKCGCTTSFDADYLNQHPQLAVNIWNTRAESPKGEWIPHYRTTMEGNPNHHAGWDCSQCGGLQYTRFSYCPACGANMRRGE